MAELIRAIKSENTVEIWRQLARSDFKKLVNYQSKDKLETPLFCACIKGDVDVVCNLVQKGAKVDNKTNWGAMPLHAAAERGHLDVVNLLIAEGSPLNHQTQFGDTPAHLAAYRCHLDVVKCLVEAGADLFIKNSERRTLLDEASVTENARIVRYLEGIIFGDDLKPTLWKTPYSKNCNPMVTTTLMNPARPHSSPSSPTRKLSVGRSLSSPTSEVDRTRKELPFWANMNYNMQSVGIEEVIRHPTLQLRPRSYESNDFKKYRDNRESEESSTDNQRASLDSLLSPDNDVTAKLRENARVHLRPRSDIAYVPGFPNTPGCHEKSRSQSLEKLVSELQCGLSYTQNELERTKASLKAAKEQIDVLCVTQNKNTKLELKQKDISKEKAKYSEIDRFSVI